MGLLEKFEKRKDVMEYVGKYLEKILNESTNELKIEINSSDESFNFTGMFDKTEKYFNIQRCKFFQICDGANSKEEVESKIDDYIVQMYCQAIIGKNNR